MNLVQHAENELKRAGLLGTYDDDNGYRGLIGQAVLRAVRQWADERHSGYSHAFALKVFNKVINHKALTDLTDDPKEWIYIKSFPEHVYQNTRQTSCFSLDVDRTYYDVSENRVPWWKFWVKTYRGFRIYKTKSTKDRS